MFSVLGHQICALNNKKLVSIYSFGFGERLIVGTSGQN